MKKILIITGILLTILACEVPDGTTKNAEGAKGPIEENREESRNENETTEPTEPIPDIVATSFKDVSNAILKPYGCVNCHGWALKEEGLKRRLKPGSPDSSRVFLKIENGDMPPAGRPVSTKDMEVLRNYINDLVSM